MAAIRASYRGAVTQHDANRLLVSRIKNFAELCTTTLIGTAFSLHVLRDGLPAFANREYIWVGVPSSLWGMSVARTIGGQAVRVNASIKVGRPQTIFVGLCTSQPGHLPPAGWSRTNTTFTYSDSARTRMTLFSKFVANTGQAIAVPSDRTWCGAPLFYWPRGDRA